MKKPFLEAGQIVSTHGVHGDVKVMPWADDPEFLLDFDTVYLGGKPVRVQSCRVQKTCVLMKLEGVDDLDAAARLRGQTVSIRREDAALPEGSVFIADLIGLPVLKLKSDYLAIATLGFAEIIRALVQLEAFAPVTNGSQLLRGFPYFSDTFMPFVIVGICIAVVVLLINSTYGRAFKAIRDDEIAAEAMGINLAHHKRMAFIISSFFAGISGALLAMYQTTVQANTFKSAMTYEILLIVVIGGIGSISGSCIGSFLFIACSEWWLRFLDNETTIETTIGAFKVPLLRTGFRMVVFSVVIMIVVLFFRRGIMGDREISLAGLAKRLTRRSVKGGKEA